MLEASTVPRGMATGKLGSPTYMRKRGLGMWWRKSILGSSWFKWGVLVAVMVGQLVGPAISSLTGY
jgi:hypothetical protein